MVVERLDSVGEESIGPLDGERVAFDGNMHRPCLELFISATSSSACWTLNASSERDRLAYSFISDECLVASRRFAEEHKPTAQLTGNLRMCYVSSLSWLS